MQLRHSARFHWPSTRARELLPVAKRITRHIRPERGVREVERVTPEQQMAAPALAVLAGPGSSLLPIALGAEKVYDEPPGAELAKRILAETSSPQVILFGDGTGNGQTKAFRDTLTAAGRKVWALTAITTQRE